MSNTRTELAPLSSVALILITALSLWLANPNELFLGGSWLLGLVSYIPLYLLFTRGLSNARTSSLAGIFYAAVTTPLSYFWLANFGNYSLWTIGATTLVYMIFYGVFFPILSYLLNPPPLFYHPAIRRLWPQAMPATGASMPARYFPGYQTTHAPLLFAVAWTAFEFFKSRGYLALPWNLTAFPFHNWISLNQIVELAGVWPISFTILLLQAAVAALLAQRLFSIRLGSRPQELVRRFFGTASYALPNYGGVALIVLLLFTAYGEIRLASIHRAEEQASETVQSLIILLVQQNKDGWSPAGGKTALEQSIDLSLQGIEESKRSYGRAPDIISWSETSLVYPYSQDSRYYLDTPSSLSLKEYLRLSGTNLVTGAPLLPSPEVIMNGVIHLNTEGEILGDYGKLHLIPFAEHIPLTNLPFFAKFLEETIGISSHGWMPGAETRNLYFEALDLYAGTPVCFEDSLSNNTRNFILEGADFLLNLTNNAWSRTNSAQIQHFVAARYRAIENRRPLLRATNGGLTSIILPDGNIHAQIPMFQPDYLLSELKIDSAAPLTFYTRYGDWFAWFMVIGLLVISVLRLFFPPHKSAERLLGP